MPSPWNPHDAADGGAFPLTQTYQKSINRPASPHQRLRAELKHRIDKMVADLPRGPLFQINKPRAHLPSAVLESLVPDNDNPVSKQTRYCALGNPLRFIGASTPTTQKTNFKMSKKFKQKIRVFIWKMSIRAKKKSHRKDILYGRYNKEKKILLQRHFWTPGICLFYTGHKKYFFIPIFFVRT